jgi:hypothetical protein
MLCYSRIFVRSFCSDSYEGKLTLFITGFFTLFSSFQFSIWKLLASGPGSPKTDDFFCGTGLFSRLIGRPFWQTLFWVTPPPNATTAAYIPGVYGTFSALFGVYALATGGDIFRTIISMSPFVLRGYWGIEVLYLVLNLVQEAWFNVDFRGGRYFNYLLIS